MSHRFLFFQHRLSRPVSSITMEDFFLIIRSFCHLSVIPSKSSKIKKNFDGVRYIIITLNAILLLFLRRLFGFLKKESSKIGQFFDRIQRWEYLKFFVFTSDKWRSYLASSFLSASLIVFSRKKNFEITRIIFDLNWIEWIVNWFELIEGRFQNIFKRRTQLIESWLRSLHNCTNIDALSSRITLILYSTLSKDSA